jgi:hypothetical protein
VSHRELPRCRGTSGPSPAHAGAVATLGLAAMTLSLEAFLKSLADGLAAGDRQMAVRFSASLKTWLETTNLAERLLASA